MADKKISALTTKVTSELTDYICIVDNTAAPIETKKQTIAQFLVSHRIKQGESGSDTVAAGVIKAFIFTAAIGTAVDGSDYNLIINCTDGLNSTTIVCYEISNRTQNGFNITPVADAYIEFTAILI
jgi:hypothetical protein